MTILVFCPNLVGDTVMATPAFRALRLGWPEARIVAVIKPKIAATLDGGPWFDDRIGFDPRSQRPEERSLAVVGGSGANGPGWRSCSPTRTAPP